MKVYGPYKNKEGREFVIIIDDSGNRKTKSYPKYLVEQRLGRELDPILETIDHIDGDFLNNDPSNLRILPLKEHVIQDVKRRKSAEATCIWCGKRFTITSSSIRKRYKQKAGPFCGRKCVGEYGAEKQNGRCRELDRNNIKVEYFKLKDLDKP